MFCNVYHKVLESCKRNQIHCAFLTVGLLSADEVADGRTELPVVGRVSAVERLDHELHASVGVGARVHGGVQRQQLGPEFRRARAAAHPPEPPVRPRRLAARRLFLRLLELFGEGLLAVDNRAAGPILHAFRTRRDTVGRVRFYCLQPESFQFNGIFILVLLHSAPFEIERCTERLHCRRCSCAIPFEEAPNGV